MSATEVIYLHHLDTLDSLRSLLSAYPPKSQVWLVAPFEMPVLNSLVNLKLLKRAADSAAIDMRLVSLRSQVRILAREAGIIAYWSLPLAMASAHRTSSSGPYEARRRPISLRAARHYQDKPRLRGLSAAFLTLVAVVVSLALVVASIGLFMPSADVTLRPVTTLVEARFQVSADIRYHSADFESMTIPARTIEIDIDGRGDTPATGRLDVNDAKAEGEVVFSNKTSEEVIIPAGTVVRSGVGIPVRFATLDEITLAAQQYSTYRVRVLAIDAGPIGNVGALTINQVEGSLASKVDVLNDAPTGGGTVKRVATIAYGDFDRLRQDLNAKLQQEAFDQMVASLAEGEFIPPSTVETVVVSQSSDQIVDQQAEMLAMTMKLQVHALVVDGAALQQVAAKYLEKQAVDDSAIIASSLTAAPSGEMRYENNILTFGVLATGQLGPRIDYKQVKDMIKGMSPEQAIEVLNKQLALVRPAEVYISPDWWPYLPAMAQRIKVNILADAK
ncbi:MAG: baseplate J/gp47 family protein [Anaerolineae bacterium]